jgi:hypothetical protein|tara:strand:- start:9612 stop:9725 length:114 start_codon:yes stop_codon:yes gene_type:complete
LKIEDGLKKEEPVFETIRKFILESRKTAFVDTKYNLE